MTGQGPPAGCDPAFPHHQSYDFRSHESIHASRNGFCLRHHAEDRPIRITGWLPGYPDPEYYLRLLFQSTSRTNEGGFADPVFDELIEAARQERSDRGRLERFHEADRYAVAERVAVIPLVYGRSTAFVRPQVHGWWEFGKSSANFADLLVDQPGD